MRSTVPPAERTDSLHYDTAVFRTALSLLLADDMGFERVMPVGRRRGATRVHMARES
jgi:hypothetical protein